MKQVLITGGAGFIGSHLVNALLASGYAVRVLDNLSTGKRAHLPEAVDLIVGDIRDFETVKQAVMRCDLVFHEAALVSVPRSVEEPLLNHNININGTLHLFEAARLAGVQRVVYASSAAVYGNAPQMPKQETDIPEPVTPYAVAKLVTEQYASVYNNLYGMECVGLRYMNVFGPRQDPKSPYSGVLSIFCRAAMTQQGVTIFGDGTQTRDFVFVADVVQANILAGTQPFRQPIYNVGRGEQTSLNDIVCMLSELTNDDIPITYAPERVGDIKHSVADITQARTHLGFEPQTSVIDGLAETLRWFRKEMA